MDAQKVLSKQQRSVPKLPALPPGQPVRLRSCAIQVGVTYGRAVGRAAFLKELAQSVAAMPFHC